MIPAADFPNLQQNDTVRRLLEVVCRTTGLGFAAVARVTEQQWIACAVRDEIGFGLQAGDELQLETTICNEIRQSGHLVVIDHVDLDQHFCAHPTPKQYGFQSYISVPITLADGRFFGTLCGIDPKPARLNTPATIATFTLFAELIAFHLEAGDRLTALETTVAQRTAALHESNLALRRQMHRSERDRSALRALAARVEGVREQERTAIARELHDALGQSLTAIKIDLAAMRKLVAEARPRTTDAMLERVDAMESMVEGALDEVERIVSELRPAVLDSLGCVAAAEWLVSQFNKRTGIQTSFDGEPGLEVPGESGTAVFRILQEALTNVSRHAAASSVVVRLARDRRDVVLFVGDNGRGLLPADRSKAMTFGLRGMAERVRSLHGAMSLLDQSGKGVELTVRIPIPTGGAA